MSKAPGGSSNKVKELVERFEQWEKKERAKDELKKKPSVLKFADYPESPREEKEVLPPVTPRGQVKRLRDMLEAKTKQPQEFQTCIPARKNANLRRLQTSYYEKVMIPSDEKEVDESLEEGPSHVEKEKAEKEGKEEPYVHVDAYWDEGTQAYWYQNEELQWLVYDERTQMFVDPGEAGGTLCLSEQVAASVNRQVDVPLASLPNSAMKNGPFTGGLSRPQSFAPSGLSPQSENEDKRADDKEKEPEDRISLASFSMLNVALGDLSEKLQVPIQTLRKFHLGVQLYALVKSNGGMLKPIILHLAVDRGKIYIVRQGRSRFLTVRHFSECDYSPSCIDFMAKEGKTTPGMKQTIQGLRQQPVVVLWTSEHFTKKNDGKAGASKGMAFVFDNRNLKGEFLLVLRSMVDYWLEGIPFKFKEFDDDDPKGNQTELTNGLTN